MNDLFRSSPPLSGRTAGKLGAIRRADYPLEASTRRSWISRVTAWCKDCGVQNRRRTAESIDAQTMNIADYRLEHW